ncbi:MAG: hypothetical protein WC415_04710 [Patescibacteria group bacterium]|jgi:hypothetical protein
MNSTAIIIYRSAIEVVYAKIIKSLREDSKDSDWKKTEVCEQTAYLSKILGIKILLEQPHAIVEYKGRTLYLNKKQTDELAAIFNLTNNKLIEEATLHARSKRLAAYATI